jgi:ribosomal protein S8
MIHTDKLSILFNKLESSINQSKETTQIRYLKYYEEILRVLVKEGVIQSYKVDKGHLIIILNQNSEVKIKIIRISKPGRRVYFTSSEIANASTGMHNKIYLLSTSEGIMSNQSALLYQIGGEVLSEITYKKCI